MKPTNTSYCQTCQAEQTLAYVPGRKYVVKTTQKVSYLKEERVNNKPVSLSKLDVWLRARKVDLGDYVRDMEEKEAPLEAMSVGNAAEDGDLEMVGEQGLAESDDEELLSDEDEDSE